MLFILLMCFIIIEVCIVVITEDIMRDLEGLNLFMNVMVGY